MVVTNFFKLKVASVQHLFIKQKKLGVFKLEKNNIFINRYLFNVCKWL